MPFRFRFQTLLRHRRHLLEEAQSALATIQHKRMRLQTQMEKATEHLNEHRMVLEEEHSRGMDVGYFLSFRDYLDLLERQLQNLKVELATVSSEIRKQKEVVLERDKAVKILETLEGNDRQAYRYSQTQKEQRQLDEVAVFNDSRKQTDSERG